MKRSAAQTEPGSDQLALWPEPRPKQPAAERPPRPADEDRLWSISDVGRFLGVPVATIYQWRVRGEGPPATKLGKHLRYEPGVVRAWVREHREGA
jgi:predicted DNA-binding transcriptional regulator AlpA